MTTPSFESVGNVPFVVRQCCDWLQVNALAVADLFVVDGNPEDLEAFYESFERGVAPNFDSFPMQGSRAHAVASLLRRFFREMKEPLVPASTFRAILDLCEPRGTHSLEALRATFTDVPLSNLRCIWRMSSLLRLHCLHNRDTTPHKLAISLAPNFFLAQGPHDSKLEVVVAELPRAVTAMELLISHFDSILPSSCALTSNVNPSGEQLAGEQLAGEASDPRARPGLLIPGTSQDSSVHLRSEAGDGESARSVEDGGSNEDGGSLTESIPPAGLAKEKFHRRRVNATQLDRLSVIVDCERESVVLMKQLAQSLSRLEARGAAAAATAELRASREQERTAEYRKLFASMVRAKNDCTALLGSGFEGAPGNLCSGDLAVVERLTSVASLCEHDLISHRQELLAASKEVRRARHSEVETLAATKSEVEKLASAVAAMQDAVWGVVLRNSVAEDHAGALGGTTSSAETSSQKGARERASEYRLCRALSDEAEALATENDTLTSQIERLRKAQHSGGSDGVGDGVGQQSRETGGVSSELCVVQAQYEAATAKVKQLSHELEEERRAGGGVAARKSTLQLLQRSELWRSSLIDVRTRCDVAVAQVEMLRKSNADIQAELSRAKTAAAEEGRLMAVALNDLNQRHSSLQRSYSRLQQAHAALQPPQTGSGSATSGSGSPGWNATPPSDLVMLARCVRDLRSQLARADSDRESLQAQAARSAAKVQALREQYVKGVGDAHAAEHGLKRLASRRIKAERQLRAAAALGSVAKRWGRGGVRAAFARWAGMAAGCGSASQLRRAQSALMRVSSELQLTRTQLESLSRMHTASTGKAAAEVNNLRNAVAAAKKQAAAAATEAAQAKGSQNATLLAVTTNAKIKAEADLAAVHGDLRLAVSEIVRLRGAYQQLASNLEESKASNKRLEHKISFLEMSASGTTSSTVTARNAAFRAAGEAEAKMQSLMGEIQTLRQHAQGVDHRHVTQQLKLTTEELETAKREAGVARSDRLTLVSTLAQMRLQLEETKSRLNTTLAERQALMDEMSALRQQAQQRRR